MTQVLTYGLLSVIPLVIGALAGTYFNIKEKFLGAISAFGAGAMIAAITFGLMEESFKLGGFDNSIIGFLIGGILFIIGDLIIIKIGGRGHKRIYSTKLSTGWGIVLAAILDGIPEAMALGASLLLNQTLGLLVLVGIMLNNFPEAITSAYDLKRVNRSTKQIMLSWFLVAVIIFVFVILGYTVFSGISPSVIATIQSLAAGALLAMIASTMMPEAYKESGLDASLATVLGFLVIFILSKAGI